MKSISIFIVALVALGICFVKCTSDKTKVVVYGATTEFLEKQIKECNQKILENDTTLKAESDTIEKQPSKILTQN